MEEIKTIQLGFAKRTVYFKSRSQNGTKYKTERFKSGNCFCSCEGFKYGSIHNRVCWHVKRVREMK